MVVPAPVPHQVVSSEVSTCMNTAHEKECVRGKCGWSTCHYSGHLLINTINQLLQLLATNIYTYTCIYIPKTELNTEKNIFQTRIHLFTSLVSHTHIHVCMQYNRMCTYLVEILIWVDYLLTVVCVHVLVQVWVVSVSHDTILRNCCNRIGCVQYTNHLIPAKYTHSQATRIASTQTHRYTHTHRSEREREGEMHQPMQNIWSGTEGGNPQLTVSSHALKRLLHSCVYLTALNTHR